MSGHHDHAAHAGSTHRWRLLTAFVLTAAFFVVELVGGLLSGSLALISDAGHMGADVIALGAAVLATWIAGRPDRTGRRTFGSYRAEVFASGLAVLIMIGVGVFIAIEAIDRLVRGSVAAPTSTTMMVVGVIGLVVNLVSLGLLRGGAAESLNVKGAYLEVLSDAAGSVGVLIAGVLVATTGHGWWDSLLALLVAVFVGVRAVILGREVLAVLGQYAPVGIDPADAEAALVEVAGVREVHDLHLWTLTSGMNVATAHLVIDPSCDPNGVLQGARTMMRQRFSIEHATLQVEPEDADCGDPHW